MKGAQGGRGGKKGAANVTNNRGGLDFGASKEELQEVKFWLANRINEGDVHVTYDEVDTLLRVPEDDEFANQLMELVGFDMEFVEKALRKRRDLVDGGLKRSDGGLVMYQKQELAPIVKPSPPPVDTAVTKSSSNNKNKNKKSKAAEAVKAKARANREECYCMGLEHEVIGNCLSCGKIICAFEGPEPCLFCGAELKGVSAAPAHNSGALADAVQRKDALLDYERRGVARSMIFDDQADYFNVDSQWMSQEEKKRIQALERERREKKKQRGVKMAVDIFGRRMVVTEDGSNTNVYEPFNLEELMGPTQKTSATTTTSVFHNPTIVTKGATKELRPTYVVGDDGAEETKQHQQQPQPQPQQRARIQHRYFEVEEEDQQQQQQQGQSATGKSPFLWSGVAENVEVSEEPRLGLSKEDRTKLIQLCKAKRASHYILRLTDAISDADVADCAKQCQANGVGLVFSQTIASSYSHESSGMVPFERLIRLAAEHQVAAILLDFSVHSELQAADKASAVVDTLAKVHTATLAALQGHIGSGKVSLWLRPCFDVWSPSAPPAPHIRKYLNELHETAPKSWLFVMSGEARTGSLGFSREYAESLKAVFGGQKQRSIIVIDAYPSRIRPICLHPYSGRQVGLSDHWAGLFCCAASSFALSRVGVSSALDYMSNPANYDPVKSLELSLGGEESEVSKALTMVIQFSPTRLQSYMGKGERDLLRKRLDSGKFLAELAVSVAMISKRAPRLFPLPADEEMLRQDVLNPLEQLLQAKKDALAVREAARIKERNKNQNKKKKAKSDGVGVK